MMPCAARSTDRLTGYCISSRDSFDRFSLHRQFLSRVISLSFLQIIHGLPFPPINGARLKAIHLVAWPVMVIDPCPSPPLSGRPSRRPRRGLSWP
jgi:hypothetical protein